MQNLAMKQACETYDPIHIYYLRDFNTQIISYSLFHSRIDQLVYSNLSEATTI